VQPTSRAPTPARRCESCGAGDVWTPAFGRADLLRCVACGGWTWIGAVPADPGALYDEGYFNGREYTAYGAAARAHERNFRRKLGLLRRHADLDPARVRLLEVGCATGEFLAVARAAGVAASLGIEPSAWCRRVAAGRGQDVRSPDDPGLARAVRELRPNLVVAWDVWEHLARPASTLDALLADADARVVVAISTVDAGSLVARLRGPRWRQFHPPTHLHYPTRESLRRWLARGAFAVRHHGAFGLHRPLAEYWRGLGGAKLAPDAAARRPWNLPLYVNLWDIQLVIAERAP
jgi:hypothetical protein